jgi:hypothetical protein
MNDWPLSTDSSLTAIEEELPHEVLFARVEPDRRLEVAVVEHRVGEAEHVEDDVEPLGAGPGQDVLGVLEVLREDRGRDAELEVRVVLRQGLHRFDRSRRLVEAVLHGADLVVDVADPVQRDADADEQVLLGAELHDAREHRDGARRRQAVVLMPILRRRGRCFWNISTISGRSRRRGRLAAGDVEVFDRAPERAVEDRLELGERHVGLAVAPLPVVAHRALGVADPGAV